MKNVCTSCGRVELISEMERIQSINAETFEVEECFKKHLCSPSKQEAKK